MKQLISGGSNDAPSATVAEYATPNGGGSWDTTLADNYFVVPTAGTLSHLRVELNVAPGASKSLTFDVMQNGSPVAPQVVISGASATTGENTADTLSVSAGDLISLRCTPSGTPTVTAGTRYGMVFTHTTPSIAFASSTTPGPSTSAVRYNIAFAAGEGWAWTGTESLRPTVAAINATITSLYVKLTTAPGGATSWTFCVVKNGTADTSTNVTITGAATSNVTSGLSVDVAPGDLFTIRSTPAGGPAGAGQVYVGIIYTPDVDGQWQYALIDTHDPATNTYFFPNNYDPAGGWLGTENLRQSGGAATGAFTYELKTVYARVDVAPGAGTSRTYAVSSPAATPLSITATIADAATTGSGSGTATVQPTHPLSIKQTLSGAVADASIYNVSTVFQEVAGGSSHLMLMGVG